MFRQKSSTASSHHPRKQDGSFEDTPRILSSDEKRSLIMAHAQQRAPKDSVQRITLWAGVMIAVLAIVGGWFWTVGYQVKSDFMTSSNPFRELTQQLDAFTESVKSNPIVNTPKLQGPTSEAAAKQFETILKSVMDDGMTTATNRNDLLSPRPVQTSATNTATDASATTTHAPGTVINPFIPGLEPDQPTVR